jgi:ArsR family transcriptional regulator, arsenate/arsenite/antimonite-responsive transcriptional repressor
MMAALAATNVLFRAFADETRLRLLNLLLDGETCVCHLCDVLKKPQPTVSRHLAYLRRAGLVNVRQEGRWKHYAVIRKPSALHKTLLMCVRDCLRQIDVLRKDLVQLGEIRRQCGC